MERMMPSGHMQNGITNYVFNGDGENKLVKLPEWVGKFLQVLMFYGVTLILWIVTYFRLKEKEV